jgi:hypothetical protein
MIKCNYVHSLTPLTNETYINKLYKKQNVKIKTFYKKGIKVASNRQQYVCTLYRTLAITMT